MRSDWAVQTVADLGVSGVLRVEDGNHGEYRPRPDEFSTDGTSFIRAAEVVDGSVDFARAGRINNVALARIRKGIGRPLDILLTHKGTVGRVGRVTRDAPPFVCSPQTTFWRILDTEVLDRGFLYAYMRSPLFAQQIYARGHGSDMAPYVSLTDQRGLMLPVPSIDEQRAIGAVMTALDDKIENGRHIAATLEEVATTLFRARFVDFVDHDDRVDSEIGPVPRGWTVAPAGDVVRVVGGSTPSTKEPQYWDGGSHAWATPKDLSGHASPVLLGTARQITDAGVQQISSKLLPKRTVLLSSRAPIGYTVIGMVDVAVNQGFIAIPPSDGMPSEYVLLWLRQNMDRIKANAGGTTFAEISKRAFRPLPMLVPPRSALAEFERVAHPLIDLIAQRDTEVRLLSSIRDSLLPWLMSGNLRPDLETPRRLYE